MQCAVSIELRVPLLVLSLAGAAYAQIEKPPQFEEKPAFHKSDTKPVDGTSHVGAIGERVSRDLLRRLASFADAPMKADEQTLFESAYSLMKQNRPAQAYSGFAEAVKRYPGSVPLQTGRAIALFATGQVPECVRSLLELSAAARSELRIGSLLGETAPLAPELRPEIERRLRTYVADFPAQGEMRYYLGRVLAADQDPPPEEAVLLWKDAARLDTTDPRPCLELARFETAGNHRDAAIKWLEQALARDPDLADAHYRLGRLYVQSGQEALAEQHFRRFRELSGSR